MLTRFIPLTALPLLLLAGCAQIPEPAAAPEPVPENISWILPTLSARRLELETVFENREATQRDIAKQRRTFKIMRLYEAVPTTPDLEKLREMMEQHARHHGFAMRQWEVRDEPSPAAPLPPVIPPSIEFEFAPGHLARQHHLSLLLSPTDLAALPGWLEDGKKLVRLVLVRHVEPGPEGLRVTALAWSFLPEKYPLIRQDPIPPRDGWTDEEKDLARDIDTLRESANPALERVSYLNLLGARSGFFLRNYEERRRLDLETVLASP